jgi:ABC-type sulfate transport system permease component
MIAMTLFAMLAPAVAASSDDPIPNLEALALAPTVGWLMLLAFALIVAIFTIHRETWRRLFLRAEDPRSLAAFRIAFGLMTLANINGLWELF